MNHNDLVRVPKGTNKSKFLRNMIVIIILVLPKILKRKKNWL